MGRVDRHEPRCVQRYHWEAGQKENIDLLRMLEEVYRREGRKSQVAVDVPMSLFSGLCIITSSAKIIPEYLASSLRKTPSKLIN